MGSLFQERLGPALSARLAILFVFSLAPLSSLLADGPHAVSAKTAKVAARATADGVSPDSLRALKLSLGELNTTDDTAVDAWVRQNYRKVEQLSPEQKKELLSVATFAVSSNSCLDTNCPWIGGNVKCWVVGCFGGCKWQYKFTKTDSLGGGYGYYDYRCKD